jgi:long-chain fatty acid transport protein
MPAAPTSAPRCRRPDSARARARTRGLARPRGRAAAGLAAALLAAAAGADARAAGFASARFGGEHGNVTTSNPTALYYNPAGIAHSSGTNLFVDGVLAWRRGSWVHAAADASEAPDPPDAQGANTGRAELSNLFGAPMLGLTSRWGDLAAGAAVYVPFGGRSAWTDNARFLGHAQYPLAADGVQRWHSIQGALTFAYVTAGAAYRLGPLAIGATANLVRSSVLSTQAKNVVGNGEPDTTREGRVVLDVSGIQGSFGLGALLEAVPGRLWLGASYQAQPGLGEMRLDGTLKTYYEDGVTGFDVTFHQALPDVLRVGLRWRPHARVELRASGERARWSVLGTQCVSLRGQPCAVYPTGADATGEATTIQNVRRRWRDTVGGRLGASLFASADVELHAAAAYETGATPDETLEPGLMDSDNVTALAGTRCALPGGFAVLGSLSYVHYLPRDTTGKSQLADAELPTRRADAGGKYTLSLALLQLGLEKRF